MSSTPAHRLAPGFLLALALSGLTGCGSTGGSSGASCISAIEYAGSTWVGVPAPVVAGRSVGRATVPVCQDTNAESDDPAERVRVSAVRGLDPADALTQGRPGEPVTEVYVPVDEQDRTVLSPSLRALLPDDVLPGCRAGRRCSTIG